jgi:hypothetical protein
MRTGPYVGGFDLLGAVYLLVVVGAIVVPMILGRGRPPGDDDDGPGDGPGGGSGSGSGGPSPSPRGPSDGIPLPDARPSRLRLRGPGRIAHGFRRPARRSAPHPPSRPRPRV